MLDKLHKMKEKINGFICLHPHLTPLSWFHALTFINPQFHTFFRYCSHFTVHPVTPSITHRAVHMFKSMRVVPSQVHHMYVALDGIQIFVISQMTKKIYICNFVWGRNKKEWKKILLTHSFSKSIFILDIGALSRFRRCKWLLKKKLFACERKNKEKKLLAHSFSKLMLYETLVRHQGSRGANDNYYIN